MPLVFLDILPEQRTALDIELCRAVIVDHRAGFRSVICRHDMRECAAVRAFDICTVIAAEAGICPDIVLGCAVCPMDLNVVAVTLFAYVADSDGTSVALPSSDIFIIRVLIFGFADNAF